MANHKSAEKRIRQTIKRTDINRSRTSKIKSFIRKVEEAIVTGDKSAAGAALKAAQPVIMKGVSKGVLRKETASRKISRLAGRIKKIAA